MRAFFKMMAWPIAFVVIALSTAILARAQITVPGLPMVPLGYCQLTSITAATPLTSCAGGIPAGATMALIQGEGGVRYRDDGQNPSTTVGVLIASGGSFLYSGRLSALRVIDSGGKTSVVNVLFYR